MLDYEKMYLRLFNAITDALNAMANSNFGTAAECLKAAQEEAEELYLASSE